MDKVFMHFNMYQLWYQGHGSLENALPSSVKWEHAFKSEWDPMKCFKNGRHSLFLHQKVNNSKQTDDLESTEIFYKQLL